VPEEERQPKTESFGLDPDQKGLRLSLALVLFLLPVGLMVGAMRWNIGSTLDADLKWIMTKFCDTVLLFCIALPLCPLLPGDWGSKLSQRVFRGLFKLLTVAKWIGILVFVTAAVISLGYCGWLIWTTITG
jgi:hypothetical protein